MIITSYDATIIMPAIINRLEFLRKWKAKNVCKYDTSNIDDEIVALVKLHNAMQIEAKDWK